MSMIDLSDFIFNSYVYIILVSCVYFYAYTIYFGELEKNKSRETTYEYQDISNLPVKKQLILKIPKTNINHSNIGYIQFWSENAKSVHDSEKIKYFVFSKIIDVLDSTCTRCFFDGLPSDIVVDKQTGWYPQRIFDIVNFDKIEFQGDNKTALQMLNDKLTSHKVARHWETTPTHADYDDKSVLCTYSLAYNTDLYLLGRYVDEKFIVTKMSDQYEKILECKHSENTLCLKMEKIFMFLLFLFVGLLLAHL